MGISVLGRLAGVAIAAAAISLGTTASAWAGTTITIDSASVGQTAAAFPVHRCDPALGGGPFPGEDVWVFALPRPDDQGEFRSVTVEFATEGGPVTETITKEPADDRAIVGDKAWIRTSAGLSPSGELVNPFSIINATAMITGKDGSFVLAQTCPATGGAAAPTELPVTGPEIGGFSIGRIAGLGGAATLAGLVLIVLGGRRRFEA